MVQPVVLPSQYMPKQQDTSINTSASIPEPMKLFDDLDHQKVSEPQKKYLPKPQKNGVT